MSLILSLTFGLTACGGSNRKTSQAANDLNAEQRALSDWLSKSQVPNSRWSAEELNVFEAKINRLEQVERDQARLVSKNPGYKLEGTGSSRRIAAARYLLSIARSNGEIGTETPDNSFYAPGSRADQQRRGRLPRKQVGLTDLDTDGPYDGDYDDGDGLRVSPDEAAPPEVGDHSL